MLVHGISGRTFYDVVWRMRQSTTRNRDTADVAKYSLSSTALNSDALKGQLVQQ